MRTRLTFPIAGMILILVGCGDESLVPATGTLLLDGKPFPAALTFHPTEGTKGPGGFASTNPEGRFYVVSPQGGKGILPGKYKVTVERLPARRPVDEKAAVTDALSTKPLPPAYADPEKTVLIVVVESADVPINLSLDSKPK